MSNDKKAIAKVSVDDESGVIMARAALPAELEARRKDLLDPAAIGAARDGLDNFEDRLSHLNSMSNLFDDDEGDGDALISMGGTAAARFEEPAAPVEAPASASAQPDIYDDEGDQGEEAVIIGGLSHDDDMMDDDFLQTGEDDGLLSSFNDKDPLDFGDEAFEMPAADPVLADAPGPDAADVFASQADVATGEVDFTPADEDEIARNAQASQFAIETGEALNEHAEQLHFEEEIEDPSEIAESSYPDPVYAEDEPEAGPVRIESPVIGADVAQSLGSMVGRRRDRQDADTAEFTLENVSALAAGASGLDTSEDDNADDLWGAADQEDGFTGSWGEDPEAADEPVFFKDDFAETGNANIDPADTDWGFPEEAEASRGEDTDAADQFEAGSSMADPTPWAGFGDDTDAPGQSGYAAQAQEEDPVSWTEDETDYSAASEVNASGRNANYNFADEIDTPAQDIDEGAERVRAKQETNRGGSPGPDAEVEPFDGSWMDGGEVMGDESEVADTPDLNDEEAEKPAKPAKGKKNLGFIATSAAVVALIAGAGYLGAVSIGLVGGGQPQPAASFPAATPAQPVVTPAAPAIPAPAPAPQMAVPAEVAPVETDPAAVDTPEDGGMMPGLDLFDPEAPLDAAPAGDLADPALDEGNLSDLAMEAIPEPAGIETPVAPVDEAADGLENIARGLSGAADGNLDSLFLTDNSTPLETEEVPAFDPAMVTDLLVDYARKEDTDELRSAIDLMFEKVNTISEEVTERDERILELEERVVAAGEKAARAETLALAQNEVLVEFVRVKEKVDMAESLIVDLSRRISSMETTDPADRVAVERSLEDILSRMDSLARDVGLVARVAINGTPEKVRSGTPAIDTSVPGSSSVYESTKSGAAAPGDAGKVPSNVKVGDFVEGYGYVLQIMPTSDGSRVVVMENKSVLLPN